MENSQNRNGRKLKSLLPVIIAAMIALAVGAVFFGQSHTSPAAPENSGSASATSTPSPKEASAPTALTPQGGYVLPSDGVKENAPSVVVYLDFICPACQQFHRTYGETLQGQAAEGAISLEYRPISVLDRASTTNYSSRAMNSFACVVETKPEAAVPYIDKLMEVQPREGGAGLTDKELATHAASVGATDAESCITEKKFRNWVNTTSENALNSGLDRTPYVVINGEVWDGNSDLLQSLSSARIDSVQP